jgi:hypothetical protein
MKAGSLFCFVVMKSTEPVMLQIMVLVSLESSGGGGGGGVHGLACFHNDSTCGAKVLEY